MRHSCLQGHLRVVKEPVLRVEADVVEALDKRDVCADVELRLELRTQLQQQFLLLHEAELCVLENLTEVKVRPSLVFCLSLGRVVWFC